MVGQLLFKMTPEVTRFAVIRVSDIKTYYENLEGKKYMVRHEMTLMRSNWMVILVLCLLYRSSKEVCMESTDLHRQAKCLWEGASLRIIKETLKE